MKKTERILAMLTLMAIACWFGLWLGYTEWRQVTTASSTAVDSPEFPDTAVEGQLYLRELPNDKLVWYVFNGSGWVKFRDSKESAIDSRSEGDAEKAYSVTDEWGTTADGVLPGRGITPSVVAERSFGFRTTGTWKGVLVPEYWSEASQKFVPDFTKAVFSPPMAEEGVPPADMCNVHYHNEREPGTWRLNMRHYESGECRYYIYAQKIEKENK